MTTDKKSLTISMRLAILADMMTRRAAMMLLVTLTSTVNALAETNGDGTVTVTFNCGIFEGFADTPEAQTISVGSTAQRPADIRVNAPGDFYRLDFDGWYQDEACELPFNFETPVTENITLYAGYTENEHDRYSFFDGVMFYYGMTEKAYAMYQKAPYIYDYIHEDGGFGYGRTDWYHPTTIRYFDLIDGLDWNPETHTLTFDNYNGPAISIYNYSDIVKDSWGWDVTPFVDLTIEFKGTNNIYMAFAQFGYSYQIQMTKVNVTFTGTGTVNLDYPCNVFNTSYPVTNFDPICFMFMRENGCSVVWDGPTLNISNMMGRGVNQHIEGWRWDSGTNFKMLSGEINIEYIPLRPTGQRCTWNSTLILGKSFDLQGGSLHVRYKKAAPNDTKVANFYEALNWQENHLSPFSEAEYATGTWPVLEGEFGISGRGPHLDHEPTISPDFDIQVTVDDDLKALGFNAVPYYEEDFDFSFLTPVVEDHGSDVNWLYEKYDPIKDINKVQGLSYNYGNYIDLAHNPHKLVMNNYTGRGLRIRSMNYKQTPLIVEVLGENTIYCNEGSGLWFEDVDVTFIGDGTLRIIGAAPDPEGVDYRIGDWPATYVYNRFRCYSAILSHSTSDKYYATSLTINGPDIIVEGCFNRGSIVDFDGLTILKGNLYLPSVHEWAGKNNCAYDRVINLQQSSYQKNFHFNAGNTIAINYDWSPMIFDTFLAYPYEAGLRTIAAGGEFVAGGTLVLAGEERVVKFLPYYGTTDRASSFTQVYPGQVRRVMTKEVEDGRALVRVEQNRAYVTFKPGKGMELKSVSYQIGDGASVPISADGQGQYVFTLPDELTADVTITPVFGKMECATTMTVTDQYGAAISKLEIPYGQEWTDIPVTVNSLALGWFQNEGKPDRAADAVAVTPFLSNDASSQFSFVYGEKALKAYKGAGERTLGNRLSEPLTEVGQSGTLWVHIPKSAWESAEPGEYEQDLSYDAVFISNAGDDETPEETYRYGLGNDAKVTLHLTIPEAVTLSFDGNGGTGTAMADLGTRKNVGTTLPACTYAAPEGKMFLCWNTQADGKGQRYVAGREITVSANTTLYAEWGKEYVIDLRGRRPGESVDIPMGLFHQLIGLRGYYHQVEGESLDFLDVDLNGEKDLEMFEDYNFETSVWTNRLIIPDKASSLGKNYRFTLTVRGEEGESGSVLFKFVDDDLATVQQSPVILLFDDYLNRGEANREKLVTLKDGLSHNVMLDGRTFYRDGSLNLLCLPFALSAAQLAEDTNDDTNPLYGATILELDTDADSYAHATGLDTNDGTLYLNFKQATSIEAGKPYIVKWIGAGGGIWGTPLKDPVFSGVTITTDVGEVPNPKRYSYLDPETITVAVGTSVSSTDGKVSFTGEYDRVSISGLDKSILFFNTENNANTLFYPKKETTIGACRTYFRLNGIEAGVIGLGVAGVRSYVMNFGDGDVITGRLSIKGSGDVNGDGLITITDATLVADYIDTGVELEDILLDEADTNGDGRVTFSDVAIILDMLLTQH